MLGPRLHHFQGLKGEQEDSEWNLPEELKRGRKEHSNPKTAVTFKCKRKSFCRLTRRLEAKEKLFKLRIELRNLKDRG